MRFSEGERNKAVEAIFERIIDGESLHSILRGKKPSKVRLPGWVTFFEWLDASETISNKYARSCQLREEYFADLMLEVAFGIGTMETITCNAKGKVISRVVTDDVKRRRLQGDTIDRVRARMASKRTKGKEQPADSGVGFDEYYE